MGWWCASHGRVPALQAEDLSSNPSIRKKKKEKKNHKSTQNNFNLKQYLKNTNTSLLSA
jgi:hypothetical protein